MNNVKIERTCRIHRRKRSHIKKKPSTIVFKSYSYEDREKMKQNVYQLKDTGYYINKGFSKAALNIKAGL